MFQALKRFTKRAVSIYWTGLSAGLLFSQASNAAGWFPKAFVQGYADNKDGMTMLAEILVMGFKIVLLALCFMCFYKFVTTVSHGIEEAKKSEGGLMSTFSTYAVIAFTYLIVSLACAYLALGVLSNFTLTGK